MPGQIVRVGGRLAVLLEVTTTDIKKGADVSRPGVYPFAGYWYGRDPLSHKSYGKILTRQPGQHYPVVGTAHSHSQMVYLGI